MNLSLQVLTSNAVYTLMTRAPAYTRFESHKLPVGYNVSMAEPHTHTHGHTHTLVVSDTHAVAGCIVAAVAATAAVARLKQ